MASSPKRARTGSDPAAAAPSPAAPAPTGPAVAAHTPAKGPVTTTPVIGKPVVVEAEHLPDLDSYDSVPLNGKSALITGITGQDGSYLTEFLLSKVGTVSRVAAAIPPLPARIAVVTPCAAPSSSMRTACFVRLLWA